MVPRYRFFRSNEFDKSFVESLKSYSKYSKSIVNWTLSVGAIITHPPLFLRFPCHTVDIIVLPFAGMHFESEVWT